jgi:twitching motility protein PilT
MTSQTVASLQEVLALARSLGASDVHVASGYPLIVRRAGRLEALSEEPLDEVATEALVSDLFRSTGMERVWETFAGTGREMDAGFSVNGSGRVRGNIFRAGRALHASFRLVPDSVPSLAELRTPQALRSLVTKPKGLFIVTGPTGHGKSTTLAAMVAEIVERRSCHIVTIEDPVEYRLPQGQALVRQREVGLDTESFSAGLRAALRQDPDIILVGEMRDLETIATALTAAETGHLVLTTLHTNDAPGAVDRIIDVFPPHQQPQVRAQLAEVLLGVLSQRLIPSKGTAAAKPELAGRVAAYELLLGPMAGSNAVRASIREHKTSQLYSVMQTGAQEGMVSLEASLASLVRGGEVDEDVAISVAVRPETLRQMLG